MWQDITKLSLRVRLFSVTTAYFDFDQNSVAKFDDAPLLDF